MAFKPKTINVTISSFDAQMDFGILKTTSGKDLFDQVAKALAIREVWYFGLQYQDKEGHWCWLKLDKKISSQVDLKPKDRVKCELYFRIKYFPEDVAEELIEEITQNYFYLQVRAAIMTGQIYCPAETAVLLASYVCQIRLGDYDPLKSDQIPRIEKLLPAEIIDKHKLTSNEWLERITHCYQTHTCMLTDEAMMEYLKICQDLEMYGVSYFPIKNKRGTELWLGVDSMGLNIYKKNEKLTPDIGFPWGEVKHISYSGKKFVLKPTDKTAKEWHFFVQRVRINRQILALSIGNHELYMRRRQPESVEISQMKQKARDAKKQRINAREKSKAEIEALKRQIEETRQANEVAEKQVSDYRSEMEELRMSLEFERAARQNLEEMQDQLHSMNLELEQNMAKTEEEKQKLVLDRDLLQEFLTQKQNEIEEQERRKQELKEQLLATQSAITDHKLQNDAYFETDDMNNNPTDDYDESERNDDARELLVMENYSRHEEERCPEVARNKKLQSVLFDLRNDLNNTLNEEKKSAFDKKYEENQKKGMDKFKTLREIRRGNTKKRIDEFEAM